MREVFPTLPEKQREVRGTLKWINKWCCWMSSYPASPRMRTLSSIFLAFAIVKREHKNNSLSGSTGQVETKKYKKGHYARSQLLVEGASLKDVGEVCFCFVQGEKKQASVSQSWISSALSNCFLICSGTEFISARYINTARRNYCLAFMWS